MNTTDHKDIVNIMIVEDEPDVVINIREQLGKIGYNVAAVVSRGEEAVKRMEELRPRPDLVLMDLHLPGPIDGIDAAGQIHHLFNIPLIYLTASVDGEILERSRITEPFGYLTKPFDPNTLQSTIEIALYKHRMEERLKESESHFRSLTESAPVGIFQTDLNGHCIYVNEKWCEITGHTAGEAMERGWSQWVHPGDRQCVSDHWQKMCNGEEKFSLEYRFQQPGGKITWVFGQAVGLEDGKGCRTGYMGTIIDITEHKKIEEKLLTTKKLESLGILAGGIAHDFNNLLSVIMGNISMVKDGVSQDKDLARMLASAEKSSCEAAALAQKLAIFSKGGWLLKRKLLLPEILKTAVDRVLAASGCAYKMDIPVDLLPIYGDEGQLGQVFDNILLNAVEAMTERQGTATGNRDNGNIALRARNHVLECDDVQQLKPGNYVRVTIEDNGSGIPPEHLGRVFDPYFSTKACSSRKGMGLGLTICYLVLNKHEGAIKIESEPGRGTTVDIYLPVFPGSLHSPAGKNEIPV